MSWYILRAATRREKRAEESLREAGFSTFLPCVTRWERLGRDRRAKVDRPLFDGYMFAVIPDGQFMQVEGCDGVHAVLRYTTTNGLRAPRSVPDEIISALMQAEAAGEFDRTRNEVVRLAIGARVRVTEGPFSGLLGQVKAARGRERLSVFLDAIHRGVPPKPVDIAEDKLEAVA